MMFVNPVVLAEEVVETIEEATNTIDTSAVDKLFEWLNKIFSTPLFTYGGITITIGILIVGIIKFFFPKNKIIVEQEKEIIELKAENDKLKEDAETTEARIETLEKQMSIVTYNSPNKKVRDARFIKIQPTQRMSRFDAIDYRQAKKKRYRVRVKKTIEKAVESNEKNLIDKITDNGSEMIQNG